MKADNEASIDYKNFIRAATRVDRRRKRLDVKRQGLPSTTLIYSENDKLVVSTPFVRTELPFEGAWSACIEVHAIRFSRLVRQLPKGKTATLIYVDGKLVLGDGLYVIPASLCQR